MRVLVDLDGVCADLIGATNTALGSSFKREYWKSYATSENFGPEIAERVLEIWSEPSFWLDIPAFPGAPEAISFFRSLPKVELIFLTTQWRAGSTLMCRERWVSEKLNIPAAAIKLIYTQHKELVPGDLFIDDRPENLRAWRLANRGGTILIDAPYNREDRQLSRWESLYSFSQSFHARVLLGL